MLSDLAVTGDPLWSLTNTRHTASTLDRVTGIANVPEYIPRRIGEILRPPVLLGAALGGVLSLLWLRAARPARRHRGCHRGGRVRRLRLARAADQHALRVPHRGHPVHLLPAPACSAGCCSSAAIRAGAGGWPGERCVLLALLAYVPSEYRSAHRELSKLARQHSIEGDLLALVADHAINLRCGPVGVPNHAPIPLLALYLKTSPANVVSLQVRPHRLRRLRRSCQQPRSKKTTCSTRTTRTSPSRSRPGFTAVRRQPLLADLPALPVGSGPCTPRRAFEHPGADRRPRLRSGSSRCACR